jgi:hypothetical protein
LEKVDMTSNATLQDLVSKTPPWHWHWPLYFD